MQKGHSIPNGGGKAAVRRDSHLHPGHQASGHDQIAMLEKFSFGRLFYCKLGKMARNLK